MLIALGVLVPAGPAGAIIGGAPDGNGHPYVAAVGPPKPLLLASGTLISPTVVLTAAHVANRRLGTGQARVTFDPVADASATWYTGTAYANPDYDPSNLSGSGDWGVIVLDTPVSGITPASLPREGLLDELGPPGLSQSGLTGVGYGISERASDIGEGKPGRDFSSGGTRRVAQETFTGLTPSYLKVRMEGGAEICSGDSGGPSLLGSSNVVGGVTAIEGSLSGGECRSNPWYERVDTPAARAFLGQYVTLP
jgi:hypothetical protein